MPVDDVQVSNVLWAMAILLGLGALVGNADANWTDDFDLENN